MSVLLTWTYPDDKVEDIDEDSLKDASSHTVCCRKDSHHQPKTKP